MTSPARSSRTQTQLAGVTGRGLGDDVASPTRAVIDETQLDSDVSGIATDLATHAATAAGTGVHGRVKTVSLDGADETTPPGEIYAVTGLTASDVILSVLFVSTKASVATVDVLDVADWTPGADTLTSLDEVDRTNDQLLVTYLDVA